MTVNISGYTVSTYAIIILTVTPGDVLSLSSGVSRCGRWVWSVEGGVTQEQCSVAVVKSGECSVNVRP